MIGTRMPFCIYPVVAEVVGKYFPHHTKFIDTATKDSFIFGYREQNKEGLYTFLIVQAARNMGRLSAEVAVSKSCNYPYYRFSDIPNLGTFGFREKALYSKDDQEDYSMSYGPRDVGKVARELVRDYARDSLSQLIRESEYDRGTAENIWPSIFRDWQEANLKYSGDRDRIFSELEFAQEAENFMHQVLEDGTYTRFLGPLKRRYESERFFYTHLYLLANGLEFIQPPKLEIEEINADTAPIDQPRRMLTYYDIMGPIPVTEEKVEKIYNQSPAIEDPIFGILKRQEQSTCVKFSADPQKRKLEYVFLKTISALEVLLES